MKKLITLLLIVVVAVLGISLAKNGIAQSAVQGVFKKVTGLDLKIASLNLGLRAGRLDARGIRLNNPPGFTDPVMVDMPVLLVDLEPASLFKSEKHLEEVQLDLKELLVVKNKDGKLNLDYLKPAGSKKATADKPAKKSEPIMMRIDSLKLKIGKVIYKDYSKGGSPSVQEFDLNLNETYSNITNVNAIMPLIISKAIMNTTLGKLINFDVSGLVSQLDLSGANLDSLGLGKFKDIGSQAAKQAQGALSEATKLLQGTASGSGDAAKDLTKSADEAVKGVADLFGSLTKKAQ
jgi:uncharacterized protein involved in outer membrane biogenesis